MDFSISVSDLQSIVGKIGGILKLTMDDVTSMMLIDATGDYVKFCGTSGSVHAVINAKECKIIEKGKVLLQLREVQNYISKFAPFVDGFGTKEFRIVSDGKEGIIKTKTEFVNNKPSYRALKFKLYNVAMLPPIKEFEDAQIIINSNIILEGLYKILPCVDPNEIRRAMSGVYVSINSDSLVFAGTNGIKLSEAKLPINADIAQEDHVIAYSMAVAIRAMLDRDSQVFMRFEGRDMYIRCNDLYLSGGLILNETYPNYKGALTSFDKTISIPKNILIDNVAAATGVLDAEDNFRVTINFTDNIFTLKNDRIETHHEFDTSFAHNLDTDVNGAFLLAMISHFSGDELELCFTDNSNSIIFRSKDNIDHTTLLTRLKRR